MAFEDEFHNLLETLGSELGLPSGSDFPERRTLILGGGDVRFNYGEGDPEAFHVLFDFGVSTAGRTLTVYRLMLEANLLIYAQDQAQMGIDSATGAIVLFLRISLAENIDVRWLAETLVHYVEHGHYWRDKIMQSSDAMFDGIGNGDYEWIRV